MGRIAEKLNLSLTDTGSAVMTGTVLIALAALIVPAFGVLSALVSVLVVSLLVGFFMRPRIQITSDIPDRIVAGCTVSLTHRMRNTGRLPIYNLCVSPAATSKAIESISEPQIIPHIAPDDVAEVTITVRALRRGRWQLRSPTCQSGFPFNLFRFGASARDEHTLVVLPFFSMLQIDPTESAHHICTGTGRLTGRAGLSTEYAGNRPFMPGDSLRTIDARAWARLSTPATREYHSDLGKSAALILDTAIPAKDSPKTGPNGIEQFEAAVSLCASVAFSINTNRIIEVLLTGNNLLDFTTQPEAVRLERTHDALAAVEPTGDYPSPQTAEMPTERFAGISEVYIILLQWNQVHQRILETAENAGCHCTTLIVAEPDPIHADRIDSELPDNVRFVSPDDILAGRLERL